MAKRKDAVCLYDNREADIAYAYRYERVVVFDFARSCKILDVCGTIEKLKNGRLFSPKYESRMKFLSLIHISEPTRRA